MRVLVKVLIFLNTGEVKALDNVDEIMQIENEIRFYMTNKHYHPYNMIEIWKYEVIIK